MKPNRNNNWFIFGYLTIFTIKSIFFLQKNNFFLTSTKHVIKFVPSASVSPGMFSSFRKMSEMWHPHVYAHPPKKPTPFSIDDILQQQQEQQQQQQQQQLQRQQQKQHLQFQLQQKNLLDGLSLLSGGSLSLVSRKSRYCSGVNLIK